MATVTKDFRIKSGLVVEGPKGTINGSDIITEDAIVGGTQTNIAVTYDAVNGVVNFVAENGVADSTTDDLVEGATNKYYTDERVDDRVANLVQGGTGITATYDDNNNLLSLSADFTEFSTDDIVEGTSNLFFTDQRAIDAVGGSATSANTPNTVVKRDANGDFAAGIITADKLKSSTGSQNGIDLTNGIVTANALGFEFTTVAGGVDINAYMPVTIDTNSDITLTSNAGDIILNADGQVYVGASDPANIVATHSYVDNAVAGLAWKEAVHLLATSDVDLTGATGTLVIDGHAALEQGDNYRLLLVGQTVASENGIYDYSDNGTTYTLTRSADADTVEELHGAAVFVMEGTQYNATSWVQNNHYATTFAEISWTQFSGTGNYTAGVGLDLVGREFQLDLSEVSTSTLPEGTNLYFTDARAVDALEAVVPNFTEVEVNSVAKQIAATTTGFATLSTLAYAWPKATYRSAKFLVKVAYGTHTEVSEVLLTLDTGDNIAITEYAVVGTNGSLSGITAGISGSNVQLLVTPNSDATITVVGTLIS